MMLGSEYRIVYFFFFFQAEDGIRDGHVTGVQTCALPISQKAGEDIKDKIGADTTVSVIENFDKQLYVFGDNWGRGTEILYQEMELKMPDKVKEMALDEGYYAISSEVLPEFSSNAISFTL